MPPKAAKNTRAAAAKGAATTKAAAKGVTTRAAAKGKKTETSGVSKPAKKPTSTAPKTRQRKAKSPQFVSLSDAEQDESEPKSKKGPAKRSSPTKTVVKGNVRVTVPEDANLTIDLTSDIEDDSPAATTPPTSGSTTPTTEDSEARSITPVTPNFSRTILASDVDHIPEREALCFGHRWIPWDYEATAWRNWHDQAEITFLGQQYVFSKNMADDPNDSGDCLFRALASLLTGDWKHHLFVRAEHCKFWQEYDSANRDIQRALGEDLSHVNSELFQILDNLPGQGQRTMRQRLGRQGIWQHIEILELTALLYRVQVIVFDDSARPGNKADHKLGRRPADEVDVRSFGSRNRTQLLLRFTGHDGGNHFQPMFADVDRPDEYRCELLDELDVDDARRHFQYRSSKTRKGDPSAVPYPFLWRPSPVLKWGDVSILGRIEIVAPSTRLVTY